VIHTIAIYINKDARTLDERDLDPGPHNGSRSRIDPVAGDASNASRLRLNAQLRYFGRSIWRSKVDGEER